MAAKNGLEAAGTALFGAEMDMIVSAMQNLTRRSFLAAALAAPLSAEWAAPVLDIHLHTRGGKTAELSHLTGSGTDKAILLPGGNEEAVERARALAAADPAHFLWFVRADVTKPDAIAQLTQGLKNGALGLGEIKNAVEVDGPEMRRVYSLAAEFRVPVLFHLEEGLSNSGIGRLENLLKAFPKTTFIGHGPTFWVHISGKPAKETGYPAGPVQPGGLMPRLLRDYANLYGDLSANSGRNALARDSGFTPDFLKAHRAKLMFGSDCPCPDGKGTGQNNGQCIARATLSLLQQHAEATLLRQITWENAHRLLGLKVAV